MVEERILTVNKILRNYNWQFIHPYIQEYQIDIILSRYSANQLTDEFINDFFIGNFYNLDSTLTFIDGFFKRSVYFEPFNYFIENSLILCFQRDYAGAINVLLPCIEGILSRYLETEESIDLSRKRYENIKKASWYLKQKLIRKFECINAAENLKNPFYEYNKQKEEYLLKQERKYFDDWFDAIEKFMKESLFASTETVNPTVELNRHEIMHSLALRPYDTLENYIKLFNCLRFLVWVFLQIENKSILNTIETKTFINKRLLYEAIIDQSEKLLPIKNAILRDYSLNTQISFSRKISFKSIFNEYSFKIKLALRLKVRSLIRNQ